MVNLKKLTHSNLYECFQLEVTKEQENFVAPNVQSIAEAYASVANGGFATPYAIYNDDVMVGFIMYTYFHKNSNPIYVDAANAPCYYIWRLLIDKNHQRKGYGRQAVAKVISEIKTMPYGEGGSIFVSYEPTNVGSKTLFASLGFKETGEIDGDINSDDYELIAKLSL